MHDDSLQTEVVGHCAGCLPCELDIVCGNHGAVDDRNGGDRCERPRVVADVWPKPRADAVDDSSPDQRTI